MRAILLILLLGSVSARADFREFKDIPVDAGLADALERTISAGLKEFPELKSDDLALSAIDLTDSNAPVRADFHGDASFYPASLIKLFFMVEIFHQGKHSPEIERALREMIYVSDNDAAAYLVDRMSDTTAGMELEGEALSQFIERRRGINQYFDSLGYDISAMMKPWSFGPFGREMQLLGPNRENRNRASANSIASLMSWIVRRRAVSPAASEAMLALLERPLDPPRPQENQIKDFIGESLPAGSKLWSKSGETSEVRHDAAYFELPNGRKLILVILTKSGGKKQLVPRLARELLAQLDR